MLKDGLYEQVINRSLDNELAVTDKLIQTAAIDPAEAAKVLAQYITGIVEKGLQNVRDNGGDVSSQVELVNKIISSVVSETQEDGFDSMSVAERAEMLLALMERKNSIQALNEKAEIIYCTKLTFYRSNTRAADVYGAEKRDSLLRPH